MLSERIYYLLNFNNKSVAQNNLYVMPDVGSVLAKTTLHEQYWNNR